MALTASGHVYIVGRNNKGQLGLGDNNRRSVPILNPHLSDIIAIGAGGDYSMALTSFGKIYVFGDNSYGQLGLGDNIDKLTPTLVTNINDIDFTLYF